MSILYEYYNTWNSFDYSGFYGVNWVAQTFTTESAHKITSVKIYAKRYGYPGICTFSIKATDGNGHPTGDDLVSGTMNGSLLTESPQWINITLGNGYDLNGSTKYALVMRGGSTSNIVYLAADVAGAYSGGCLETSTDSGSNWSSQTSYDALFEVRSTEANIISSVSLGWALAVSRGIITSRTASNILEFQPDTLIENNISNFLCIGSVDGGSIKTLDRLGASWNVCAKDAGGGLDSTWLAQFENHLCTLSSQNTGFAYSAVNDITTNWTEKPNFPNLPSNFTGMFVGKDANDDPALYFLTPTGMYYLDVFTNFVFGPTELQWEYDSTSGKKGIYWKGAHYIAAGKSIYQLQGGIVTPIGPDMDDGLPETLQGAVTDMMGVGFWLVIAVDGGSLNKSSILKRYISGNHWHTVYVGSVNTPIRTLMWDSGTLYFGEGTNVKSLPMSNTTDNVAKLSTYTYSASGDLIHPYFHSEFEAMPKVAHKLRAVTQDCNSNEKITISYRTDENTSWTSLGSFTSSPRPAALSFPSSGDAVGVSFERIQFKDSYARGDTTTNSPKLESLVLEYRVVPPVLWGWDFRAQAMTTGDTRGQDIINALKTAMETGTLLSFYPDGDKDSTEYFVEVAQMPGLKEGTEFGQEGIFSVSVQEVID